MKIAIVRLSAIGDIVQSMIVLQFLRKKFPNADLHWFVDEKFSDLVQCNPDLSHVHSLKVSKIKKDKSLKKIFQLVSYLRNLGMFDYVIDLQGLLKSAIIARLIKSKNYCGYSWNSIREPFASLFYNIKYEIPYETNVIKRYVFLINQIFKMQIVDTDILDKRILFDIENNFFENKDNPQVLIIIGASFKAKIYPIELYSEIINSIDADFLIVWKSEEEEELAKKLKQISPKVKLSENLDFKTLITLVFNSKLIIGGDTGPTHIAWALNKPSITIFGPTPSYRNCFETNQNLSVKSDSIVNPYKIDKSDMSIKNISADQIIKRALLLLRKK